MSVFENTFYRHTFLSLFLPIYGLVTILNMGVRTMCCRISIACQIELRGLVRNCSINISMSSGMHKALLILQTAASSQLASKAKEQAQLREESIKAGRGVKTKEGNSVEKDMLKALFHSTLTINM